MFAGALLATTPAFHLYCVLAWDKSERCNLVALDERDGSIVWEDRVDGECVLDAHLL